MLYYIRRLKLMLLDLFATPGKIKVSLSVYQCFYRTAQEFVGTFKLYDDSDWKMIERNLIHKECEYLSFDEAVEIKRALDRLEFRYAPSGQNEESINLLYDSLHPKVCKLARPRMEANCYADAVESVFKEINSIMKEMVKSATKEEKDGVQLMQFALGGNRPIVQVTSALDTLSDRDIQQGYQFLFSGAMAAIRNPKAHGNVQIKKVEAFRFLMFASTLMTKLDGALVMNRETNAITQR